MDDGIVECHDSNADLFTKYFDHPAFRDLYLRWITEEPYTHFQASWLGTLPLAGFDEGLESLLQPLLALLKSMTPGD